jgi:hypothetical protein
MSLDSATISLQPGQQLPVDVVVKLPANTPAGGHYGAIRFIPATSAGNKTVNLAASVASLILLRVSGVSHEQVSIASFYVAQNGHARTLFTGSHGLEAVIRFQNTGDLQEEPFGKLILQKGAKTLQSTEINNVRPPSNVLPGSIRRFTVNLTKVGDFGKYTAYGNFGYGSNGQLLSASATFYIIPVRIIIISVIILLLVLFAIFGLPRLLRAYYSRSLGRNTRRR